MVHCYYFDSISSALCAPGYYSSNGGCIKCPANTFKDTCGSTECESCPAGTMSAPGSTSEDDCIGKNSLFP